MLICALVSFQEKVFSQSIKLDSTQVERITKTCQLWGHLKFFHANANTYDWESAFTDNIEQVIAAKNSAQFGKAIQSMLDRLNDPVTKLLTDPDIGGEEEDTEKHPKITYIQDSVLLVTSTDYNDLEDFNFAREQFLSLKEKMPLSNGVIIDIRSDKNIGELKGNLAFYFEEIESHFSVEELQIPGLKAIFHDGFIPETGGLSGGYFSGTYSKGEKKIIPATTAINKPILFMVNEHAEIPRIAFALQMAGKAKIISTSALADASIVETLNYDLDDSLEVSIRLNELPSDIDLKADYIIPPNKKDAEILALALQLLKGQKNDKASEANKEREPTVVISKKGLPESDAYYPDLGHRLLAAAKIWTVIDYFFAYRDLMEEDWEEVLKEFVPRFASVTDSVEYNLAVAEMYNNIQDGHGFIRSKVLSEYLGEASPPVKIRFIEDKAVIVAIFPDSVSKVRGLDIGDIVLEIDSEKVSDRFKRYAKITAASNQSWLHHSVSWNLLNGNDSTNVVLTIQKGNGRIEAVTLPRNNSFSQYLRTLRNDRNQTPMSKLINENIGYADLDRLSVEMVDQMFDDFKDTKAIIFDMRGYPNGTAWSIAPYLTSKEHVYAANFRRYSPMGINIGTSIHMSFFNQEIPPMKLPTYKGKTVMLIDERTISQAEHTGLFFEAANGTKFIGSQTAGANGDVTNFKIPGNIILSFSGHDVRHIDGRQLQKIGLVPDLPIKPSIEGIRNGKDEVLEKAIEYVESIIKE
jgi:C-terminal processing protease CtpA/Prc